MASTFTDALATLTQEIAIWRDARASSSSGVLAGLVARIEEAAGRLPHLAAGSLLEVEDRADDIALAMTLHTDLGEDRELLPTLRAWLVAVLPWTHPRPALFQLGAVSMTPGAQALFMDAGASPADVLRLHAAGQWGELDAHDHLVNEVSLREGMRLLSTYTVGEARVWVISEAGRHATTVLLPSEY